MRRIQTKTLILYFFCDIQETTLALYYFSFKNLKNVDSKEIDGVTASYIGRKFSYELYEQMIDRIYSLDLFDDVSTEAIPGDPKKNTVSIVFTVTERPVVTRIFFSGNRQVRTAELKETVSVKEKDVFIEDKMLVDERSIRDVYLEKGYTNIKVSSKTKSTFKLVTCSYIVKAKVAPSFPLYPG